MMVKDNLGSNPGP